MYYFHLMSVDILIYVYNYFIVLFDKLLILVFCNVELKLKMQIMWHLFYFCDCIFILILKGYKS